MFNWSDKKKAKSLCSLWAISQLVSVFTIGIHASINSVSPGEILSGYHLASVGLVMFYFIPLMHAIRRYSQKAQMKKLSMLAYAILIIYTIWLIGNLIAIIAALFR